eukprot:3324880-Rhodomonas_salina.1
MCIRDRYCTTRVGGLFRNITVEGSSQTTTQSLQSVQRAACSLFTSIAHTRRPIADFTRSPTVSDNGTVLLNLVAEYTRCQYCLRHSIGGSGVDRMWLAP